MKIPFFLLFGLCFSLDALAVLGPIKSTIKEASFSRFGLGMEVFSKVVNSESIDLGSERNKSLDLSSHETGFSQTSTLGFSFNFSTINLNQMTLTIVNQDKAFDPSLIQYSINKPNLKFERNMKSFNDGRYTTFGNAYLVYGLARDFGLLHW